MSQVDEKKKIKLNVLNFELIFYQPYSPDLLLHDYSLFAKHKIMILGKRFDSIEEVIAKVEAYFKSNEESFYEKCI